MATNPQMLGLGVTPFTPPPTVGSMMQQPMGMDMFQPIVPPAPDPEPESVISRLGPGTDLHKETIQKLLSMFNYSKRQMTNMHHRWSFMEQKVQAYVRLPNYEEYCKQMQEANALPPEPYKIIVPYTYATVHAAATFISSVLLNRRPVFPLMAKAGTGVDKARYMENALQSNLESGDGYEVLWQLIWDSLNYSFGVARVAWVEEYGKKLVVENGQRNLIDGLRYAGNKLHSIDPYNFYPDPRVPIAKVNVEGDFVFWVQNQSKMTLKMMEQDAGFKWVDQACTGTGYSHGSDFGPVADSNRRIRIGMNGQQMAAPNDVVGWYETRECTVRLVPKDWKFSDSDRPELWKFTMVKDKQIIQAEPLGMAHMMHPVVVAEPTSFGHDFGSLSMVDMIGPFQDLISWHLNSRIENVRATVNNQFIANPGMIEMQDFRQPAAGKIIRLKQAAMGLPIKDVISQLTVADITQGHVNDIQLLRLLADTLTGINDNMRGIQNPGGRKSATEARMAMQAGASRQSQNAIRVSQQAFMPLAKQMIMNIQQFMPEEMWVEHTGDDGVPVSSLMTPDMAAGSFDYMISDGSLPYDKTALLEVWKEIMLGVAQDPELRQNYSLSRIFEYVAELGGAKNISSFGQTANPLAPQIGGTNEEIMAQGGVPMGPALPARPR